MLESALEDEELDPFDRSRNLRRSDVREIVRKVAADTGCSMKFVYWCWSEPGNLNDAWMPVEQALLKMRRGDLFVGQRIIAYNCDYGQVADLLGVSWHHLQRVRSGFVCDQRVSRALRCADKAAQGKTYPAAEDVRVAIEAFRSRELAEVAL